MKTKKRLYYTFKMFYKDGPQKVFGCRAARPEELYNDFDGLVSWEEYDKLCKANLTTKQILEMAARLYAKRGKPFDRIEIINVETGEVVDFVEIKD